MDLDLKLCLLTQALGLATETYTLNLSKQLQAPEWLPQPKMQAHLLSYLGTRVSYHS